MNRFYYMLSLLLILTSCQEEQSETTTYKNQIGDTEFNPELDRKDFQFCNPNNVLHKRAYVSYSGGKNALNKNLQSLFEFRESFTTYNGYIIVRFAVNCNNESGRFRFEFLDNNFNLTEYPIALKEHIKKIFKSLNHWNHAIYQGKDYDCYTFRTMKITNGKIELL